MEGRLDWAYKILRQLYFGFRRWQVGRMQGLSLANDVVIKGRPIIEIGRGARVEIEKGVMLNSRNSDYHINMHSPVKLFADREGAVITIGANTRIHGACIHAYKMVSIGRNCLVGGNCQIMDASGHQSSFHDVVNRINTIDCGRPIVIEDCVWVGANCLVLPGVRIGRGSIIAAGSDIPSMVIAAGNPAKPIRSAEDVLSRLGQNSEVGR